MEIFDLTHTVDEKMPTWSARCGFRSEIRMDYDQGLRVMRYQMAGAAGTHIDAPSHFIQGGEDIDHLPLENLIVPLVILDLSDKCSENLLLSVQDIQEDEKKWGSIQPKSLVIVQTGWEKFWNEPERYRNEKEGQMHFPSVSEEAATYLLEKEIVGLGIDTLSPDLPSTHYPVHQLLLGKKKYILENVCGLDLVPKRGMQAFVMPLKIKGGTESPIRLIAINQR